MEAKRFFLCKHCGNLVGMIESSGVEIICCGEPMTQLVPGSEDASHEKHVPVVTIEGDKVSVDVGSAAHPMTDKHYITWIFLQTEHGGQRKVLHPGDAPHAVFALTEDKPVAVYAYCNLHGLWKTDI